MAAPVPYLIPIPVTSHVCMLDGPDYRRASESSDLEQLKAENEKLKALLIEHGISWAKTSTRPAKRQARVLRSTAPRSAPLLPIEVQLRILSYAMKHSHPIIDPFVKRLKEHITKDEYQQSRIPVHLSEVSKTYHTEATRLFFSENSFIFTQVAALERFGSVPADLRAGIEHIDLRIVGRYYDNQARRQHIFDNTYHPDVRNYKLPIMARPFGAEMDLGIHSYCWHQVGDFLRAMRLPGGQGLVKMFPSLNSMRMDLVNFCQHLSLPRTGLATVIRWHAGRMVDELIVTGIPQDDPDPPAELLLSHFVSDEGVYGVASPAFVSGPKFLKPLKPIGLYSKVLRACTCDSHGDDYEPHPEGGKPPKSTKPFGKTIWKYALESLVKPKRKWIEFDRATGIVADDIDYSGDEWDDDDEDDDFFIPNMAAMFAV